MIRSLKTFPDALKISILAMALTAGSFFLQADYGLDLLDEGFLWYGAVQTHLGRIPLVDFQSYDPGRYYWASFFFSFLGDGLIALRASMAFFQAIALFFGLWAVRSVIRSWIGLVVFGLILVVWMMAPFRHFEYGLPMIAILLAMRLMERPAPARYFACGLFAGAAACFGMNHSAYTFLAFQSLIIIDFFKGNRTAFVKRQGGFFLGVLSGYLPMVFMFIFTRGFLGSYAKFIQSVLQHGTNLPLPVPWPWTVDPQQITRMFSTELFWWLGWMNQMSTAVFFLTIPVFLIFSGVFLIFRRKPLSDAPLLAACVFVGLFYSHHIFSRADVMHLADGIAPFLMGLVALCAFFKGRSRTMITVLACFILFLSVPAAGLRSDLCHKYLFPGKGALVRSWVGADRIWLTRGQAELIEKTQQTVSRYVGTGQNILVLPYWPALYCLLKKTSPVHEIYFLRPSSEEDQKEWIHSLNSKKVDWVLWGNERVFGRQFDHNNALLKGYLKEKFEIVPLEKPSSDYLLLHRKEAGTARLLS